VKRWVLLAVAAVTLVLLVAPAAQAAGPLIVLDPGHSGSSVTTIDPVTHIRDEEYDNGLENHQVFDVAGILQGKLEAAGYSVLLTKDGPHDTVTKRERVALANDNQAALAVSIHTSGHVFGQYGLIFVQRTDGWRGDVEGNRWYFDDPGIAALSARYGLIFQAERRKVEYAYTKVAVNNFSGRGLAPGNLSIVQLWAQVPWVYCEAGVMYSQADKERYAQSLFNSITACIPLDTPPTVLGAPCAIRYQDSDSGVIYSGSWLTGTTSLASGGSVRLTDTTASASVTFTGTSIGWISATAPTYGLAQLTLDGQDAGLVDLYSSTVKWQQKVWNSGILAPGSHTLTIAWTGQKNNAATSSYIGVDALDIIGAVQTSGG
jgi:N-acetylmuramoyl-L-alanine amidase